MYLKLRIAFTILSAVCVAALLPVGAFLGLGWAGACGLIALVSFGVVLLCKQNQELDERKKEREQNNADFLRQDSEKKDKME